MGDRNKLCRICGENVSAGGIQMDEYVECTSVAQMLSYCTKLDIDLHDNAPNVLCLKCKDNLLIAYKLIVLYHKTSEHWKELRGTIETNVEQIDVTPEQGRFCTLDSGEAIFSNVDPIATSWAGGKKTEATVLGHAAKVLQEPLAAMKVAPGSYNFQQDPIALSTTCSTCGEEFTNTWELRDHRRLACGMDDCILKRWANSRPKCCGCNAEFDSLELLRAHSKSVHSPQFEPSDPTTDPLVADRKQFVCNVCFRRYSSRSILLDHKQRPYRAKLHQCAHCGKAFRDKYSLDDHERVHGDERPFVCDICSKTFAMRESYRKHLQLHKFVPDRFKCDVCGKGFRTAGNLKEHYLTHSAVKTLQCPQCSSQYSRKSCLKSHMRLHTGEKPYKCEFCDAIYAFPSDLRRHVMAHKGIKPFACVICNKAYRRKDYLAKHIASSHPEETEMKPSLLKETEKFTSDKLEK